MSTLPVTRAASTVRPPTTASHVEWHNARRLALAEGALLRRPDSIELDIVPIAAAAGRTLAHDLFALTNLPHFSSSAMDGWAVCGDGPWELGRPIRAGESTSLDALKPGSARAIATGAPVPANTTAIVRREQGETQWIDGRVRLTAAGGTPAAGRDIRVEGEEARHGEPLLLAGSQLTAPRLALASVAGYDEVSVVRPPVADLVMLGDELRSDGLPRDGRVRDAFSPSLPSAFTAAGARPGSVAFGRDSLDATVDALIATRGNLVVSTGGTARGPADFIRAAIDALGARIVCDGVAMRPGHPVIIARLDDDRLLLALPGNPLAALLAFASLGVPIIDGILGRDEKPARRLPLAVAVENHTASTRILPCSWGEDGAMPTAWQDPGMLRGVACADIAAVIPPGGAAAGDLVETLPLPW